MTTDGIPYLQAALEVVRAHLEVDDAEGVDAVGAAVHARDEARRALSVPPALEVIGDRFGLTGFERQTLLMCAGTEFDIGFAHACARAQGDPERTHATFALALGHLPGAAWAAMSPAGPLRRWRLVRLAHPLVPTTSALQIDERVLHALVGVDHLDADLAHLAEALPRPTAVAPPLAAAAADLARHWAADVARHGANDLARHGADNVARHGADGAHAVVLHGRARPDLRLAAAEAAAAVDADVLALAAVDLPADPGDRHALAVRCGRESRLSDVVWVVEVGGDEATVERALAFVRRVDARVIVAAPEPSPGTEGMRRVEIAPDRLTDRRALWTAALTGREIAAGADWVDRLAGQFALGPTEVDVVVAEADPPDGPTLWAAARRRARPTIDDLAQRIAPSAALDDLVLPDLQRAMVGQIAAHLRHRLTVLEEWGFGRRGGRGLGTAALFTGPSGTGKTLAAEVIAAEVGLDLYRVDLSQTLSKYIGETEKNLRRIFDAAEAGGAVLLFDEADALFGRRSEVKDSHDRHANIEVGYLLQRVEAYRGLAVLTTNLKDSLDPAFLRRLRFVVTFPFPDRAARTEIWRRAFPPDTPTKDLDLAALGRLSATGAEIHNIALSAAYRAADADGPVDMTHVLAATRAEYVKLERPLPSAEVTGWTR